MRRIRRPHPVDVVLCVLVLAQQLELWLARPGTPTVSLVVSNIVSPGALLARRRAPLTVTLVTLASSATLIQLMQNTLSTSFFSMLVAAGVIGGLRLRVALAGLVGLVGLCAEGAFVDKYGSGVADFALSAAIMTTAWTVGLLLERRKTTAVLANARAAEAEQAHQQVAEAAVAEERARLTRELHDVLAHALTVLVIQTVATQEDLDHGVAEHRLRTRLRATEEVARESLAELRVLLGILGHDRSDAPARAPGTAGLSSLADQFRAAGQPVEIVVSGEERPLTPGTDLLLYRLVQESLVNVAKHAGRAASRVTVRFSDEALEVSVANEPGGAQDLASVGSGRGLLGLQERVALYGGEMTARPTDDGGFEVRCRVPTTPIAAFSQHEVTG